ncbi:unnamed protein product [Mucor hiemalis]
MDNNVTEKVIPKEDHTNEEKQQTTVPAPIPEKSAWKVTAEPTEKLSENTEAAADWPAPKEAAVDTNEDAEKDKFVAPKVKSKGQWKPFTPTIVHASSSGARSTSTARRNGGRRTGNNESRSKDAKKTSGARRGSKSKEATPSTAAGAKDAPKSDNKDEEKKPKARSTRPKNAYRSGPRKAPAFVNVDADTLKMYIM